MQFSFPRFLHLFKLQIAVNRKLYLLGMAAIAGLMLFFMFFAAFTFDNGLTFDVQKDFIIVALLLSGTFFGSMIFKQYGEKDKRAQSMLLPVSNTERLTLAVLFTFVLFPLVFLLLYGICIVLGNAVDVHIAGNSNYIGVINGFELKQLIMIFCFTQSIVLLGAIWFRRQTFVKTVVVVCVFAFTISIVNDIIRSVVLKDTGERSAMHLTAGGKPLGPDDISYYKLLNAGPFQNLRYHGVNVFGQNIYNYYWISLPDNQMIPFFIFLGFIPLFFFYITGLKLREQQL